MSTFKTVAKGKLGYEPSAVDAFIVRARDQYNNFSAQILDWRDISSQKFPLVKGGYEVAAVDAAIDKLQDTFAERELSRKANPFASGLTETLLVELRGLLLGRAERPKNKRFQSVGVLAVGYSRKEVDALLSIVKDYFSGEEELSIDEVRALTFKGKRGGYIESQVDAYIERLVEYLQTQRFGEPVSSFAGDSTSASGFGDNTPAEPSGPYSEYE